MTVYNAGNGIWALTPVVGLGDDQHGPSPRRSEGARRHDRGHVLHADANRIREHAAALIQDGEQAELQIVFPLTMLLYIALGGLMLSGNIEEPGGE